MMGLKRSKITHMSKDTSKDMYTVSTEYAYDFIEVLSKFKQVNESDYFVDQCVNKKQFVFKSMISELFYQAIQSIPSIITHYTISCTNDKGKSEIQIGVFNDLDDQGEISIAKIITPECMLILNKEAVHNLYIANKTKYYDYEIVNTIITLLYMGGSEPKIRTGFICAKRNSKF